MWSTEYLRGKGRRILGMSMLMMCWNVYKSIRTKNVSTISRLVNLNKSGLKQNTETFKYLY